MSYQTAVYFTGIPGVLSVMLRTQVCSSWSGIFCALVLGQLLGCGGGQPQVTTAEVAGKVTYKGQPLKLGTVSFQPPTGAFVSGDIKPDGTYSLKGVVGLNSVRIVSQEGAAIPADATPQERKAAPPPKNLIPEVYGNSSSKLTFEVKPGKNTADFDLKD